MAFVPFILLAAYGIVNQRVVMAVAAMEPISREGAEEQEAVMQDHAQDSHHLREQIQALRQKMVRP